MKKIKFLRKIQDKKEEKTLKKNSKEVQSKIKIDDPIDDEYDAVTLSNVGLTTFGAGVVILKSLEGKEFPISAFSGEVATQISNFIKQKHNISPTIYNMFEQICEESELLLVRVKVYESGESLRAKCILLEKKT